MDLPASPAFRYQADELELFARARQWKAYWVSRIAPFIRGDVLEVGAGVGTNTRLIRPLSRGRYLCLEPDDRLLKQLKRDIGKDADVDTATGVVTSLDSSDRFDVVIYIDVLEHIADDVGELVRVAKHVNPGGHVIVLSPAYQCLYSAFDQTLGHYRRYNRSSLLRCAPPGSSLI
jgi:2-polyprenyl-3-methyl-5-hydroxy-6-metoxy-1,4-benzoquinol methylase